MSFWDTHPSTLLISPQHPGSPCSLFSVWQPDRSQRAHLIIPLLLRILQQLPFPFRIKSQPSFSLIQLWTQKVSSFSLTLFHTGLLAQIYQAQPRLRAFEHDCLPPGAQSPSCSQGSTSAFKAQLQYPPSPLFSILLSQPLASLATTCPSLFTFFFFNDDLSYCTMKAGTSRSAQAGSPGCDT